MKSSKGSSFEREVSKKLSLWVSNGTDDNLFWRSQSSGARFTTRRKDKSKSSGDQDGDITSTAPESKFLTDILSLECKNYSRVELWDLVTGAKGSGSCYMFWLQAKTQANDAGKIPVLILKASRKPVMFVVNSLFSDLLKNNFGLQHMVSVTTIDHEELHFYKFEDILTLDINVFKDTMSCLKETANALCTDVTLCLT